MTGRKSFGNIGAIDVAVTIENSLEIFSLLLHTVSLFEFFALLYDLCFFH